MTKKTLVHILCVGEGKQGHSGLVVISCNLVHAVYNKNITNQPRKNKMETSQIVLQTMADMWIILAISVGIGSILSGAIFATWGE